MNRYSYNRLQAGRQAEQAGNSKPFVLVILRLDGVHPGEVFVHANRGNVQQRFRGRFGERERDGLF